MMDTTKKLKKASVAALLVAVALAGCKKEKQNVAPEPDKEFQSTVDVSYAALVISDIEMACSFVGEYDRYPKFYQETPQSPSAQQVSRNDDYVFITYNKTICKDGHVRDGSIVMKIENNDPNAVYAHSYKFRGGITLTNYKVDGWSVELKNTFYMTNTLTNPVFNPKTTQLTWNLNGDFVLKHPTDASKNMHCNVNLDKTLANTSDPNVFKIPSISREVATTWSLAVVEYRGTMFGETSGNVPFKYNIDDKNPLVRDFTCYPDKVAGVTIRPSVTPVLQEFHPFTKGVAAFMTGDLYPRSIAYGNEAGQYGDIANDPHALDQQCDNKGVVTIKGISYPVDFKKDYQ